MFKIYCPTYKRPKNINTHKVISECIYVVSESQSEEYKKVNPDVNYWIVPDHAQGNLCRIRNYILDNSDVKKILLLDDDVKAFGDREQMNLKNYSSDEIIEWVEYAFFMADQFDVHFFGINPAGKTDFGAYRAFNPFSFRAYCGGPFQAHNDSPLRYDEDLPLKEDYDMTLQQLYHYRKILRFNMMFIENDFQNLPGGCQTYRNVEKENQQFILLQKKWGSKIIRQDNSFDASGIDFNPVLYIPNRC